MGQLNLPLFHSFSLSFLFNQSICFSVDSDSSHSSPCLLVYTDSARFDSYEPDLIDWVKPDSINLIALLFANDTLPKLAPPKRPNKASNPPEDLSKVDRRPHRSTLG